MALLVEGPAPAHHHHLVDDHAEGEEDGEDHPEAPLSPATVTVYLGPRPVDHLCQVINLCQSLTQKDRQQTMKNKCRCNIEYRYTSFRPVILKQLTKEARKEVNSNHDHNITPKEQIGEW